MAKEPQYKLRATVHNFSHPSPWTGAKPQSKSDSRSLCGEGIPGPSLAHAAQSMQEVLSGAWSAEFSPSSTNPVMSQRRQHREMQDWPLKQLRKWPRPAHRFSKH